MKRLIKISYLRLVRLIRQPVVKLAFGLTVIVVLISTAFLSINLVGKTYRYSIGDIATEDIRVSRDIQYNITSETARKKEQAAIMTPLVFDRDHLVLMERLRMMDLLFRYVSDTMKENPPLGTDDRTFQLYALKAKLPEYLNCGDRALLGILRSDNPDKVRTAVSKILIFVYDRGILDKPYDNPLKIENQNVTIRTINDTGESTEETRTLRSWSRLMTSSATSAPGRRPSRATCRRMSAAPCRTSCGQSAHNLSFNADETRRRIDEAVKSVKPVMGTLKRGQTLVREATPSPPKRSRRSTSSTPIPRRATSTTYSAYS
jgi:membrane-associated HD superfamily phosphohydrolase